MTIKTFKSRRDPPVFELVVEVVDILKGVDSSSSLTKGFVRILMFEESTCFDIEAKAPKI